MRTRLTWVVAMLAVVAIGFLMACSTKYSSSSNGLVVVPTQSAAVMQSFSLNLANGHLSQINNAAGPPTNGLPTSIVLDPTGDFAYVIVYQNPAVLGSATGIETFQIASDGKLTAGATTTLNNTIFTPLGGQCESIAVTPVALAIDSAGKFLFVANSAASSAPGSVSVLAISGGNLKEVQPVSCSSASTAGSPFPLPGATSNPSASALAVTPTVYPTQFAYCSGHAAPTTENLYVTDSVNYLLLNYSVNTSTGALTLMPPSTSSPGLSTGTVPSGVAVDPCNRFVYVANSTSNNISAFTICSAVTPSCLKPDFSLLAVTGSPFGTSPGDGPGPVAVDPYGNFLYVVDSGSSQVSAFRIGANNGNLTSVGTYAAGTGANSIAIRGDDIWVFVANSTSSTLSQYAIIPATGGLAPQSPASTFNTPTGVAVK